MTQPPASQPVNRRLSTLEDKRRAQRKKLADKAATIIITFGGFAVILSITALLFVIVAETLPLWSAPTAELETPVTPLTGLVSLEGSPAPLALGWKVADERALARDLGKRIADDAENRDWEEMIAEIQAKREAELADLLEDRDEYVAENVFWVPPVARWTFIRNNAKRDRPWTSIRPETS